MPRPRRPPLLLRLGGLLLALAAGAFAHGGLACRSLESLESCDVHSHCPRGTKCDPVGRFCAEGAPIRIGVVAPLTGTLKLRGLGDDMRAAVDFATWLFNEGELKPLDRGLEFSLLDDESDTATARLRAEALAADNVAAVVGPMTSGQMLEAQKATLSNQLLHLGPMLGAAALGDAQPALGAGRFLLQLSPDVANGSPLGFVYHLRKRNEASPEARRCTRTYVFYNDDVTGRDFNAAYVDRFRANGMCVRGSSAIPVDAKASYEEEVRALDAVEADCVILGTNPASAGKILETVEVRIAAAEREKYLWFGNSATHVPGFLEASKRAGLPSRAEGFYGADVDYTPIERTEYQEVVGLYARFLAARGASADSIAAIQMPQRMAPLIDAFILLALALERAGPRPSPEALRDAYLDVAQFEPGDETFTPVAFFDAIRALRRGRKIDYSGGSSNVEFNGRGFYTGAPSQIWRVANGAFERVAQVTEQQAREVKEAIGDGCK